MIVINKGESNTVVLTLRENQTLDVQDWLFEFTNDMTGEVKLFTATDISTAPTRYNEFIIEENTIEDVYNGIISLTNTGFWSYTIYEMNPSSPVDLDPNNAVKIVEIGKVTVRETATTTPTFSVDETKDNVTFNG